MESRDWIQTGADGGGEKPDCRGNGGGRGRDSNDSSTLIMLIEHLVGPRRSKKCSEFRRSDDRTANATAGAIILTGVALAEHWAQSDSADAGGIIPNF
jgi:hypothetical protein